VSTVSVGRYCTKYSVHCALLQLPCTVATTKVRETRQEQAVGIASATITKSRQKVSTNPTLNLHTVTNTPAFESSQRPLKRRLAEKGKTPCRKVVTRQRQHIAIAGGIPNAVVWDIASLDVEIQSAASSSTPVQKVTSSSTVLLLQLSFCWGATDPPPTIEKKGDNYGECTVVAKPQLARPRPRTTRAS